MGNRYQVPGIRYLELENVSSVPSAVCAAAVSIIDSISSVRGPASTLYFILLVYGSIWYLPRICTYFGSFLVDLV